LTGCQRSSLQTWELGPIRKLFVAEIVRYRKFVIRMISVGRMVLPVIVNKNIWC